MITVVLASAIFAASWQTTAAHTARTELLECLRDAATRAEAQKLAPDGFAAFAQQNCTAQSSKLKAAVWAFDSKNKVSRKQSEADAQLQIEDYIASAEDRYRYKMEPQ